MIQEELKDAYDYIIVPKALLDTPVELEKMLKEDGTYYSINELSAELGSLFQPVDMIDDRFTAFRWPIPANGEEALIITYLKSKGLVDMRDNGIADQLNYTAEEIDYTALTGNECGVFRTFEMRHVPTPAVEPEVM